MKKRTNEEEYDKTSWQGPVMWTITVHWVQMGAMNINAFDILLI